MKRRIQGDHQEILFDLSKTTQGIGRSIASPKTDSEALGILIEALEYVVEALTIMRETVIIEAQNQD